MDNFSLHSHCKLSISMSKHTGDACAWVISYLKWYSSACISDAITIQLTVMDYLFQGWWRMFKLSLPQLCPRFFEYYITDYTYHQFYKYMSTWINNTWICLPIRSDWDHLWSGCSVFSVQEVFWCGFFFFFAIVLSISDRLMSLNIHMAPPSSFLFHHRDLVYNLSGRNGPDYIKFLIYK